MYKIFKEICSWFKIVDVIDSFLKNISNHLDGKLATYLYVFLMIVLIVVNLAVLFISFCGVYDKSIAPRILNPVAAIVLLAGYNVYQSNTNVGAIIIAVGCLIVLISCIWSIKEVGVICAVLCTLLFQASLAVLPCTIFYLGAFLYVFGMIAIVILVIYLIIWFFKSVFG